MYQQDVEIHTIHSSPIYNFVILYLQEIKTDLRQLTGKKPVEIIVSLNKMHVDYLSYSDNNWQMQ